jgi:glycosyltransferase 2 family protein
MKKFLLNLIPYAIGGACLWLAVRKVSLSEVVAQVKAVEWKYLVLAFLIGIASHVFRAFRWEVILGDIKRIKFIRLFGINSVGFFFIHIFPFRLGEIIKPYLLKQKEGVRISTGLATVAIERVYDGLILVLMLIFGLIFANFKTQTIPYINISINYLTTIGALIFGLMFIFLILLVYREEFAVRIIKKILTLFPKKIEERGIQLTRTFVQGLSSLPSIKSNFWIALHSVIIWLCAAAIMYLTFVSMKIDISWEASFVALGIISLGIMLPAPPGFIGNHQLFCQGALGLYGLSATIGLSYSIVVSAVNILGVFLLGFIFLPAYPVSYKKTVEESEKIADSEPDSA